MKISCNIRNYGIMLKILISKVFTDTVVPEEVLNMTKALIGEK